MNDTPIWLGAKVTLDLLSKFSPRAPLAVGCGDEPKLRYIIPRARLCVSHKRR